MSAVDMASNGLNGAGIVNGHSTDGGSLKVAIVGAGVGGLTTAIYLRKQGHEVTILEQSRFAAELGAAMHLAPNCNGLLRRVGVYAEEIGGNLMGRLTEYDDKDNKIKDLDLTQANEIWQHPWHLIHRVRLHEALKKRATLDGATLRTASKVISVDPLQAVVHLEGGEEVQADVVVGADGIRSVARKHVPGGDIPLKSSGKSAFRFLVPRQVAVDDPQTRRFADQNNELVIWYGRDRRVVMYPCDDNRMLNFVCIHPREESEGTRDDWSREASKANLAKVYEGFGADLLALLGKADADSLKVWELLDMDPLPTWVSENLALLGDAAHPFLPHQGQGAGCAMEDAAALAVVLQKGVTKKEIPERLKVYEKIRLERAHKIQDYSRIAGRDLTEDGLDMRAYTDYNFGHDAWDYASQVLRKWTWERNPHLYWRMPISFGPMPGPRQTFEGKPRVATHSTFSTASVKFKTSRTVLENLFPTDRFKFKSPGTVAYASFSQTTLNGMEWLGGSGYRHFGLYLHGVQFAKADGEILNGTYMPILWESLTDPIVSGREELGMPKLYCSLDIFRRSTSYHLQAGWQGVTFGNFTLENLREVDPGTEQGTIGGEADDGIFAYRYIPKVGERGKADVEHVTFVPHAEESKVVPSKVQRVWKTSKAHVNFDAFDWEALPTLHHIVGRLAEIPMYEVINAKIVEGVGVPDVSSARRVD